MKFTKRRNGKMMTTVYIPIHVFQDEVEWVAEKLGVSMPVALGKMREWIEQEASEAPEWHTWAIRNGKLERCHIDDGGFTGDDTVVYGLESEKPEK